MLGGENQGKSLGDGQVHVKAQGEIECSYRGVFWAESAASIEPAQVGVFQGGGDAIHSGRVGRGSSGGGGALRSEAGNKPIS